MMLSGCNLRVRLAVHATNLAEWRVRVTGEHAGSPPAHLSKWPLLQPALLERVGGLDKAQDIARHAVMLMPTWLEEWPDLAQRCQLTARQASQTCARRRQWLKVSKGVSRVFKVQLGGRKRKARTSRRMRHRRSAAEEAAAACAMMALGCVLSA